MTTNDDRWWLTPSGWQDWEDYLADWHSRRTTDDIPVNTERNLSYGIEAQPGQLESSGAVFQEVSVDWKLENLDGSYRLICTGGMVDEERQRKAAVQALKDLSR